MALRFRSHPAGYIQRSRLGQLAIQLVSFSHLFQWEFPLEQVGEVGEVGEMEDGRLRHSPAFPKNYADARPGYSRETSGHRKQVPRGLPLKRMWSNRSSILAKVSVRER